MDRRVPLALLLAVNACHIGASAGSVAAERGPFGAAAELNLGATELKGELVAVRDSGLIMLPAGGRITFVPFSRIAEGRFAHVPASLHGRQPPTPKERDALRVASRFPQGLSPDLEQRLLAAYGQATLSPAP